MEFVEIQAKNIARTLLDAELDGEPLHLHISQVEPGERSHPPHQHGGLEAFYMLEGEGTLEIEGERYPLKANQTIVFNPQKLHGLINTGDRPMRYMVVLANQER